MSLLFLFFCLNIFVQLDKSQFCNCQYNDDDKSPIHLEELSDEAGFQRGLNLYNKLRKGEATEQETTTRIVSENEREEEARVGADEIMIYGFDANINNRVEILREVYRLFKKVLRLPINYDEIYNVAKIGSDPLHKRPVNVKLKSEKFAKEVLRRRGALKGMPLKIEAYLPWEIIREQKRLIPLIHKYRAEKKFAILRDGKLLVNNYVVRDLLKEYHDRRRNSTLMAKWNISSTNSALLQNKNVTLQLR